VDGHRFLSEASAKGAIVAVTDEDYNGDFPTGMIRLAVADPRRCLADLLNCFWGDPSRKMTLIGVTGTNGKTTVTHMLRHFLETCLFRCGIIGTVGYGIEGLTPQRASDPLANMTTPDPEELYPMLAQMAWEGVEYVLIEITSHPLALRKTDPLRFRAAVFTNLTPEHLDFHKTMEAYAKAKARLLDQTDLAIVNWDCSALQGMTQAYTGKIITCSPTGGAADYRALCENDFTQTECAYRLISKRGSMSMRCPIPGRFTVENSLLASACALELGIRPNCVRDALGTLNGVKGRLERIYPGAGANFTVYVDYAHTPDALEKLLKTVREFRRPDQRIVLLFGCGGERDRGKRPVMGGLAERLADYVILTSDNSRGEDPAGILRDILAGMTSMEHCTVIPDRAHAIRHAIRQAKTGDILLLAGKGHEEYEITREGRLPFSERDLVRSAFLERLEAEGNADSGET
jgi:UDP-N-acetylmuramoyl-L-alanyl-D-glutamate--2,6-diaminopimelate ligase